MQMWQNEQQLINDIKDLL